MELVPTRLRCTRCSAVHEIALIAERSIRDELAATVCPTCGAHGSMKLARPLLSRPPPPSERTRLRSPYEEPPDMEGDEFLLEEMQRCRRGRA